MRPSDGLGLDVVPPGTDAESRFEQSTLNGEHPRVAYPISGETQISDRQQAEPVRCAYTDFGQRLTDFRSAYTAELSLRLSLRSRHNRASRAQR